MWMMKYDAEKKYFSQNDSVFNLAICLAYGGTYRMDSSPSLVSSALSAFPNDICETAGLIETKLYAEPSWVREQKFVHEVWVT